MLVKRKTMELHERAQLETANILALQGAENAEDIMTALVELGELIAAQTEALVELAGLIEEGE